MTVPKCTSIWGHKFEAVYDYGPVVGKYSAEGATAAHHERMADKMRHRTYIWHVCVRCGCTVNRPNPSKEQP